MLICRRTLAKKHNIAAEKPELKLEFQALVVEKVVCRAVGSMEVFRDRIVCAVVLPRGGPVVSFTIPHTS